MLTVQLILRQQLLLQLLLQLLQLVRQDLGLLRSQLAERHVTARPPLTCLPPQLLRLLQLLSRAQPGCEGVRQGLHACIVTLQSLQGS